MGNRAVITWTKAKEPVQSHDLGIYLHLNGGIENVSAFLKYCELKGYRTPDNDCYGYARICQVIGNFFGGSTSVGIDECRYLDCDNGENGTYICEGWDIVKRLYPYNLSKCDQLKEEMLLEINSSMPKKEQLPEGLIRSALLGKVKRSDLRIGERVYIQNYTGEWDVFKIVGIGEDDWLNGHNVKGVPYFDRYMDGKKNINNYVLDEYVYSAEQME